MYVCMRVAYTRSHTHTLILWRINNANIDNKICIVVDGCHFLWRINIDNKIYRRLPLFIEN